MLWKVNSNIIKPQRNSDTLANSYLSILSIFRRDLLALQLTDRREGGLIDRHDLTEYTVDADTISKMMYNLKTLVVPTLYRSSQQRDNILNMRAMFHEYSTLNRSF